MNGAETWTLQKVDQKYVERFEMRCWIKMEKITWTGRMRNEKLQTVKEDRNILRTIKRKKANRIGRISRRQCFLKHGIKENIEGKIGAMERREIRSKQLLDDITD